MWRVFTSIIGMVGAAAAAAATQTPALKPAKDAIPTISVEQALTLCKNAQSPNAIPACTGILNMKGLNPQQQADIFHARALAFATAGNSQAALADFGSAIKLTPKNAILLNDRGFLFARQNNLNSAIQDFNAAIALNPNYVEPIYNLALAQYFKGDMARSIALYDRAIMLRPDAFNALGNRCLAKARVAGQLNGALADCDAALKLQPQHAMNLAIRGLVRFKAGDAKGARADCDAAIRLDPKFGWPYYVRGKIRRMQNDPNGGQRDVMQGVTLDKTIETRLAPFALPG